MSAYTGRALNETGSRKCLEAGPVSAVIRVHRLAGRPGRRTRRNSDGIRRRSREGPVPHLS
jgi:hypothetical protein